MSPEATILTHCPNCGAKLARPDLSLCAYCATPLQLGGKVDGALDETMARLKRMRDNPQFLVFAAWTPTDLEVLAAMRKLRRRAGVAFALAVTFAAIGQSRGETGSGRAWLVIAAAFAVVGILSLARAAAEKKKSESRPMLRRPAIVIERRSETAIQRSGSSTTYFFTLRFDDGSEGEFVWPGQGAVYDPLTNGMTGVAFTRGPKLIDFRKL